MALQQELASIPFTGMSIPLPVRSVHAATLVLALSLLGGCASAPSGQSDAKVSLSAQGGSRSQRTQVIIEVNPTTRGQADAIMRKMEALEKAQMADDSEGLGAALAALESAANESPFVKLPELLAYHQVWQHILSQRGIQFQESSGNRANQQRNVEAGLQGNAEVNSSNGAVTSSGRFGVNAGYKSENRSESAKSVNSSGSKGDATARVQKAKCHKELMQAFARLSFRRLASAEELLGKWLWRWTKGVGPATLLFDLKPSGEMVAELIPDNPKDWPYNAFVRTGNGTWRVLDGKLTAHMEKVWFLSNPVDFMVEREVVSFTPQRLTLEGADDNILERPPPRKPTGVKK